MKAFLILTSIVLVTGFSVYSCGSDTSKTDTPAAETPDKGLSGEEIYSANCVICHGTDGKAQMSGATDLSTSVLTHDAAVNVVTNGRNGMRAFSELSATEIDAVVTHIETLRK